MSEEHTHHGNYVKIWGILLALLVVSIVGPMFEIQALTLITAFGIAVVKAYLVAKNFMHINVQKRYVIYLLGTSLVFMLLFFAGVAPDVMKHEGDNWVKPPVVLLSPAAMGEFHPAGDGEGHGEDHGGEH